MRVFWSLCLVFCGAIGGFVGAHALPGPAYYTAPAAAAEPILTAAVTIEGASLPVHLKVNCNLPCPAYPPSSIDKWNHDVSPNGVKIFNIFSNMSVNRRLDAPSEFNGTIAVPQTGASFTEKESAHDIVITIPSEDRFSKQSIYFRVEKDAVVRIKPCLIDQNNDQTDGLRPCPLVP